MRSKEAIREKLYIIIFGTDTPAGKYFDITLLWAIVSEHSSRNAGEC